MKKLVVLLTLISMVIPCFGMGRWATGARRQAPVTAQKQVIRRYIKAPAAPRRVQPPVHRAVKAAPAPRRVIPVSKRPAVRAKPAPKKAAPVIRMPIRIATKKAVSAKALPVRKPVIIRAVAPQKKAPAARMARPVVVRKAVGGYHSIGTGTLGLTNAFRAKKRLPNLIWDQRLADIAEQHSINMGNGRVPFGHDGFKQRIDSLHVFVRAAAENVAWSFGHNPADVPAITVNGWIKSPGHYKNLVGDFTHCGIGVYRNAQGAWYYTQIFARYK